MLWSDFFCYTLQKTKHIKELLWLSIVKFQTGKKYSLTNPLKLKTLVLNIFVESFSGRRQLFRVRASQSGRRRGSVSALPVRGDVRDGPQHRVDLQNSSLPSARLQHGLFSMDYGGESADFESPNGHFFSLKTNLFRTLFSWTLY